MAPADGDLVLIERYDDQAALEHHRTTEHYLNYRAQLSRLLASPISVSRSRPSMRPSDFTPCAEASEQLGSAIPVQGVMYRPTGVSGDG